MKKKQLENFAGSGRWHEPVKINLPYLSIDFRGMITGCGLGQITNLSNLTYSQNEKLNKESFKSLFIEIKQDGVGAVLATLGQNYSYMEKRLLELGFENISEYSNYRHGPAGSYKQKLYILKL